MFCFFHFSRQSMVQDNDKLFRNRQDFEHEITFHTGVERADEIPLIVHEDASGLLTAVAVPL